MPSILFLCFHVADFEGRWGFLKQLGVEEGLSAVYFFHKMKIQKTRGDEWRKIPRVRC